MSAFCVRRAQWQDNAWLGENHWWSHHAGKWTWRTDAISVGDGWGKGHPGSRAACAKAERGHRAWGSGRGAQGRPVLGEEEEEIRLKSHTRPGWGGAANSASCIWTLDNEATLNVSEEGARLTQQGFGKMSLLLHVCSLGMQWGLEVPVGSWSSDFYF